MLEEEGVVGRVSFGRSAGGGRGAGPGFMNWSEAYMLSNAVVSNQFAGHKITRRSTDIIHKYFVLIMRMGVDLSRLPSSTFPSH